MKTSRLVPLMALVCLFWPAVLAAGDGPEKFEPFLRAHPADEAQRESAMRWYAWKTDNFERLRYHTLAMIEHHPGNLETSFLNVPQFLSKPEYHAEVLRKLEDRVKTAPSSQAYFALALIAQERAVPPPALASAQGKRRFLDYYGLASDQGLPKQVDKELVDKTIRYFKRAIELAAQDEVRHAKDADLSESDRWQQNFAARVLVDFYSFLNRHAEALQLCQTLALQKENLTDAAFLLAYGGALAGAGKPGEAKRWLLKVRTNDHEGNENGPGCSTMEAETDLGLMALKRGDLKDAVEHLQASANVQKCGHNTTKGFPMHLASAILDKGDATAVVRYCETVLRDFTPDAEYVKELLAKAKKAEQARRSSGH